MQKTLLIGVILLLAALVGLDEAAAQSITFDMGTGEGGNTLTGRVIQGFMIIGILSVAPGIVIMCTSFTRIVVVLSLVRTSLGLQNSPPNMVMTSLAMFLTFFIMQPHLQQAWDNGLRPLIDDEISQEAAIDQIVEPFKKFMLANARDKDLELFEGLAAGNKAVFDKNVKSNSDDKAAPAATEKKAEIKADDVSMRVLIPAFMISELKRAFEIGFMLMIPFLVIDVVVSTLLMSMGMMMLPPVMISLPFKIVFFVLVDGWYLVAGSLARSYV